MAENEKGKGNGKDPILGHGRVINPRELERHLKDGWIDFPQCPICGSQELLVPDGVAPDQVLMFHVNNIPVLHCGFCSGCGIIRVITFDHKRVWRVNRGIQNG